MTKESRYPASRAANVVLGMSLVAAVALIAGGVMVLGAEGRIGWLLIGLGIAPVAFALLVRMRVRDSKDGSRHGRRQP